MAVEQWRPSDAAVFSAGTSAPGKSPLVSNTAKSRMFQTLGKVVSRTWPLLLVGWIACLVGLKLAAPPWSEVAAKGEFAFLPSDSPSRVGEDLFRKAWNSPLASNIVIVVRRVGSDDGAGLIESDKRFIDEELHPRLEEIAAEEMPGLQPQTLGNAALAKEDAPSSDSPEPKAVVVRTYKDKSIGRLLESDDHKASLVVLELPTEFLDNRNLKIVQRVESLISRDGELDKAGKIPRGLDIALSGSATVGRDMMRAARESSKGTEKWTVILVLILLIGIYRAPLMAIIPLMTVSVATELSLALLACMAKAGWVNLFDGIEVYVKVLCYGAGVDYCLFLVARYKEELDEGQSLDEAVTNSLAKVGHALLASAGTVICGIFMMYFAEFGKFSQAGIANSLGLVIVLFAALTFSPALLRLSGRWAFWPRIAGADVSRTSGWLTATSLWSRLFERNWGQLVWTQVGELVRRRPGTVLLSSVLIMLPFAWIGVQFHSHLSYGLLSELPRDNASVIGADAVAEHFPRGMAGPMTVLIQSKETSFVSEDDGQLTEESRALVNHLTDELKKHREHLQLADIRTVLRPFGGALTEMANDEASARGEDADIVLAGGNPLQRAIQSRIKKQRTTEHYVSTEGEFSGKVLRLDVVLNDDPFARNSIAQFESIRQSIKNSLPAEYQVLAIGPTASIRDLKTVTDRDQIRIDLLVLAGVFLILIVLLRRLIITLYLIVSVFFSYLVTLGFTFAVFWAMDPVGFVGLDWKVPIFLFTILIAVGEDYNIFLMTRIDEEQALHGLTNGVISALQKTGSIISSCGVIMAGTFCSLMAGSLVGLHQLGFALAFGVLLDTFVVRPVLVPAFLVLLHEGRLGSFNRLLERNLIPVSKQTEVPQSMDVEGES